MIYAIDTDIYSLLVRGHEKVSARFRHIAENTEDEVVLPYRVWVEVVRGRLANIETASTGSELIRAFSRLMRSLEDMLRFRLIPFSETAARIFDSLKEDRQLKKAKTKFADLAIASTAFAHQATLVTRNTKDYEAIKILKLENWAD